MAEQQKETESPSWGRGQRIASWLNAALMVVILLAILVGVNYLAYRHPFRRDMTFARIYTLDEQTRAVIARIDKDVEVVISSFPQSEIDADIANRSKELLDEYERANRRISVELIDPMANPGRARETANRFKMSEGRLPPNYVIFYSQGCKKTLDFMELYEGETLGSGLAERMRKFRGEQLFTAALLAVSEGKKRRVYWDHGHGSAALTAGDRRGFDGIVNLLSDLENCDIQPLVLSQTDRLPDDCELYVIVGATVEFTQRDLDLVDDYLAQGGKLLVMVDPFVTSGLEKLVGKWGVDLKHECVIDRGSHCQFGPGGNFVVECDSWPVILDTYGFHDIVKDMQGRIQSIIPETCGMDAIANPERAVQVTGLLNTSKDSWAKTDLKSLAKEHWEFEPGKDRMGPISVAVAVSASDTARDKPYKNVRIVVIGDSDMIRNTLPIDVPPPRDFFLNTVRWLLEREASIRIAPKEPHDPRIELTENNTRFVFILSIFGLPGFAIFLGVFVWFRRRL